MNKKILLLVAGTAILYFTYLLGNNKGIATASEEYKHSIEIKNAEIDSLRDEVFNRSVEEGRYELSLEHLKEFNPKAAKEFEEYMEKETE